MESVALLNRQRRTYIGAEKKKKEKFQQLVKSAGSMDLSLD